MINMKPFQMPICVRHFYVTRDFESLGLLGWFMECALCVEPFRTSFVTLIDHSLNHPLL